MPVAPASPGSSTSRPAALVGEQAGGLQYLEMLEDGLSGQRRGLGEQRGGGRSLGQETLDELASCGIGKCSEQRVERAARLRCGRHAITWKGNAISHSETNLTSHEIEHVVAVAIVAVTAPNRSVTCKRDRLSGNSTMSSCT